MHHASQLSGQNRADLASSGIQVNLKFELGTPLTQHSPTHNAKAEHRTCSNAQYTALIIEKTEMSECGSHILKTGLSNPCFNTDCRVTRYHIQEQEKLRNQRL